MKEGVVSRGTAAGVQAGRKECRAKTAILV